jgi:hypothetical protein
VIRHHDGTTFLEDLTNCDGSIDATFAARSCLIPLAYLRGTTYNLVYGDLITAKVLFENSLGLSS